MPQKALAVMRPMSRGAHCMYYGPALSPYFLAAAALALRLLEGFLKCASGTAASPSPCSGSPIVVTPGTSSCTSCRAFAMLSLQI